MTDISNVNPESRSDTVMESPDKIAKVRDLFGIDSDMEVPAFSEADERVPDLDPAYVFDPDTTLDSVGKNLDFIEYAADYPFNFGRVELYAGTPLLSRMQAEGRCTGDYLQWDYRLAAPDIQRLYELAMACFPPSELR